MTTNATARLVKGGRTLTISSGRYALGRDFVPPDVELQPTIATGTSANRSGGGVKVGERAVDRTWQFSVHIQNCQSEREVTQAARDLRDFLLSAGDESEPLYLEFRASPDMPLPLWGQGVLRYEVVHGRFSLSEMYSVGGLRGRELPTCPVEVRIKPYAVGLIQQVTSASGGIIEDTLGTTDGISRGLVMSPSVLNIFTNPVFGHPTWDSGWTTGASMVSTQNTCPAFLLYETRNSAKLTARAASGNTFTQNLTLTSSSTYIVSALVKLPDSSSPTTSNVNIRYATSDIGACFLEFGNGIWRVSASANGNGAACSVGIVTASGTTIYLLGMQAELRPYPTRLCWGDLLGCAWSGTAHASTSTRLESRLALKLGSTTQLLVRGSIIVGWKAAFASTTVNAQPGLPGIQSLTFFSGGSAISQSSLKAYYDATEHFIFTDNINNAETGLQAFAAGDVVWLGFTWGPDGMKLYRDGVLSASNATFNTPVNMTDINIGSENKSNNEDFHGHGPFMGFEIYDTVLTAAEILADYNNRVQVTNDGQRVSEIPWVWTKDGDSVIDNADDAALDNWAVLGGIPGTADAKTRIDLSVSATTLGAFWLSNQRASYGRFVLPTRQNIHDLSGSTDGDASASAYRGITASSLQSQLAAQPDAFTGEYYFFARAKATAGSALMTPAFIYGNAGTCTPFQSTTIAPTASFANFLIGNGIVNKNLLVTPGAQDIYIAMIACPTSGSIGWDGYMAVPRPITRIIPSSSATPRFMLEGQSAIGLTTTGSIYGWANTIGDVIEFAPNAYNILLGISGSSGEPANKAATITFNGIWVTPRYSLL